MTGDMTGGLTFFPRLGDPPFRADSKDEALAELRAAGLPRGCSTVTEQECEVLVEGSDAERAARSSVYILSAVAEAPKEWVSLYTVQAEAFGWTFRRAWYYWICSTSDEPIPLDVAQTLHAGYGNQVRVNGSCVCPAPARDVDAYHVDTPTGLLALITVLRDQHALREAERRRSYEQAG